MPLCDIEVQMSRPSKLSLIAFGYIDGTFGRVENQKQICTLYRFSFFSSLFFLRNKIHIWRPPIFNFGYLKARGGDFHLQSDLMESVALPSRSITFSICNGYPVCRNFTLQYHHTKSSLLGGSSFLFLLFFSFFFKSRGRGIFVWRAPCIKALYH